MPSDHLSLCSLDASVLRWSMSHLLDTRLPKWWMSHLLDMLMPRWLVSRLFDTPMPRWLVTRLLMYPCQNDWCLVSSIYPCRDDWCLAPLKRPCRGDGCLASLIHPCQDNRVGYRFHGWSMSGMIPCNERYHLSFQFSTATVSILCKQQEDHEGLFFINSSWTALKNKNVNQSEWMRTRTIK